MQIFSKKTETLIAVITHTHTQKKKKRDREKECLREMLEDEVDDESNIETFIVGRYNYTVLVLLPHFVDLKIEVFFSSILIYRD